MISISKRRLVSLASASTMVATLALATGPTAMATTTFVDQSQTSTAGGYTWGCSPRGIAQSFTAGTTGALASVSLFASAGSSSSTLTVSIESATNGYPTDTILGTTRTVAVPSSFAWVDLPLVHAIPVVAGHQYAIVVLCPPAGPAGFASATSFPDDLYPGGGGTIGNPTGGWFSMDLMFVHKVQPYGADHVDLAFKTRLVGQPR